MAKRIPIDQLTVEINKILEKYGDDIQENLDDIVKDITKKGAKTLKSESSGTFNGTKYAGGWTSQAETGRVSAQGTIYNARLPGLPHLLEHGHANRGGGRSTEGRVHISKVEEALIKEFESKVKSKL